MADAKAKLNPSLFEKLILNDRVTSIIEDAGTEVLGNTGLTQLRLGSASQLERYNENSMRASVRRELGWLLNTVSLSAVQDLSRYPHVATSVLNYGMPDLTGRSATKAAIASRAQDIAERIRLFEPRLDPNHLEVTASEKVNVDNAISYLIRGDITSAVRAMPVQYVANVEIETGEAVVRE